LFLTFSGQKILTVFEVDVNIAIDVKMVEKDFLRLRFYYLGKSC